MMIAMAAALLLASPADTSIRDLAVAPGETLRVTAEGAGRPIVLIPGLYGAAYSYRNLIPVLAREGWRVVVIEPLGTGWSGHPGHADYSLTAQADRIAAAMNLLGIQSALVVSQALGTSMALRLALRHPERVRAILSIDGGPAETAATPGLRRAMRFAGLLKLFVGGGTVRRKVRRGMIDNSADSAWVTDDAVRGYTDGAARDVRGAITALRGMASSREPEALRDRLHEIRIPVRLLVGRATHDSGPHPDEVLELEHAVPDFAVDTVSGAGQFVQEERPAAVLNAIRRLR